MTLATSGPLTLHTDGTVDCFFEAIGDWSDLGHIDDLADPFNVPEFARAFLPAIERAWSDHLSDAVSDAELHAEWNGNYLNSLIGG
jgi:hypothetical protein